MGRGRPRGAASAGRGVCGGRIGTLDVLTLAAVAIVVLLVSLPRLADLALRENESDAVWMARRLSEWCTAQAASEPVAAQEAGADEQAHGPCSVDLRAWVASSPALARQLDDVEVLDDGVRLRRHGYLFEVSRGTESPARWSMRAWPWEFDRSGRVALVWTPEAGLLGNENQDGGWSGPASPPPFDNRTADWRAVRGH